MCPAVVKKSFECLLTEKLERASNFTHRVHVRPNFGTQDYEAAVHVTCVAHAHNNSEHGSRNVCS